MAHAERIRRMVYRSLNGPKKIVMLLDGPWANDSRVKREAHFLALQGYNVTVLSGVVNGHPKSEKIEDVVFKTVPIQLPSDTFVKFRALLECHLSYLYFSARSLSQNFQRFPQNFVSLARDSFVSILILMLGLTLTPIVFVSRMVRKFRRKSDSKLGGFQMFLRKAISAFEEPFIHLNKYRICMSKEIESLRPDIIHAHDLSTISAAAHIGAKLNVPYIYDVHELETGTNYPFSKWTKQWIAKYERAFFPFARKTITVCDSIADFLKRSYNSPRPTVIHNSPTKLAQLSEGQEDLRAHLALAKTVPLIVYVGAVTIDRGLDIAIKSLKFLPGFHLALVGPHHGPLVEQLKRLARDLNIESLVHFLAPVSSESVATFISTADCSIIPIQNVCQSYNYCFPNKLLESVFAKLPVVAANLVELKKFIGETGSGVIADEKDPKAFAQAINLAVTNKAQFVLNDAGISTLFAKYGWPTQCQKMAVLYSEIESTANA